VRRLLGLAGLILVLAACGGGGAPAPKEGVGVFMTRILREEINGQWSRQWTELHPGHQKLITQAQYVACSREMGTNIATGKETFHVLDVRDESIHVQDVPQKTSKLVTISFREPGLTPLTYRLHAVAQDGRWTWILGDRFLAQIDRGRCLDGTPLAKAAA
jgi:hypothetical protein